jgi:perosamine synthetase
MRPSIGFSTAERQDMSGMVVPSACPSVTPEDIEAVVHVLRSGVLANGPVVAALEQEFAVYCGPGVEAVAVSSGTTALMLAGQALALGSGDTVLVSAYTFAASANALLALGCDVVPVDVNPTTMNLDAEAVGAALQSHPRARALVAVDLFGSTAGTDEAIRLARGAGLHVIEDAAQAHGALDATGRRTGARDVDVSTFSLYATKNMAAGEGGLVTTHDSDLAARIRRLRNHGSVETYRHEVLGLNHRLPEVSAALARGQLRRLDDANCARRANASRLARLTTAAWGDAVTVPLEAVNGSTTHVFHQFTVRFRSAGERDLARDLLHAGGIDVRHFYPYTIAALPGVTCTAVPVAEMLRDTTLSIPVHPGIDESRWSHIEAALQGVRASGRVA